MFSQSKFISLIKIELYELQDLITKATKLSEQYPDNFALELSRNSYLQRQKQLREELRIAYQELGVENIEIKLTGKPVKDYSISAVFLGSILTNFQALVTSIAQAVTQGPTSRGSISKDIINFTNLELSSVFSGSFGIILTGTYQPVLFDTYINLATEELFSLLQCSDKKDTLHLKLRGLGSRTVNNYKKFLETIYIEEGAVEITQRPIETKTRKFVLTPSLAKNICEIITEVENIPEKEEEYYGQIKGVSLIHKRVEFMEKLSEKIITATFPDELEDRIKPRFDKECKARFVSKTELSAIGDEKTSWHLTWIE